jgi:MoaA/NifB/PqqE/SkfB family radical SAM enzyme
MNLETCKKVVDGFNGLIGVGVGGWGEPLLNPEIIQILNYISQKGLLITFNTNGSLLKPLVHDLVKIKHLYHIGLSLDSFAQDTNGHDSLSVLDGLVELAELKKACGKNIPH